MTMNQTIITNEGRFHADDAMAVAILKEFIGDMPVTRTRKVGQLELKNSYVWVVDVGSVHDYVNRCFDHHQDSEKHSTCVLVADYLNLVGVIEDGV
jgi:uncharacterized UPF0160 family protein